MKPLSILTLIILLFVFCYGLVNAGIVQQDKMERVQTLYDYGLIYYHEKGSKYQGCYLLRQAVREARFLNDNMETHNTIYPVYEATCKSAGN